MLNFYCVDPCGARDLLSGVAQALGSRDPDQNGLCCDDAV
jgi:hypothetical protein